jgi:hypothetical protein
MLGPCPAEEGLEAGQADGRSSRARRGRVWIDAGEAVQTGDKGELRRSVGMKLRWNAEERGGEQKDTQHCPVQLRLDGSGSGLTATKDGTSTGGGSGRSSQDCIEDPAASRARTGRERERNAGIDLTDGCKAAVSCTPCLQRSALPRFLTSPNNTLFRARTCKIK